MIGGMSSRIARRWIIRLTCLGALLSCSGLWGISYFYDAQFVYGGSSSYFGYFLDRGTVTACGDHASIADSLPPPGWNGAWEAVPAGVRRFTPDLYPALGFDVGWAPPWLRVQIPLWFPTAIFGLASWLAWRKTAVREPARGFPVQSHVSRPPEKTATRRD